MTIRGIQMEGFLRIKEEKRDRREGRFLLNQLSFPGALQLISLAPSVSSEPCL